MKRIPLNAVKDGLWRYLREAEREEVIEEDPRFLKRIAQARRSIARGKSISRRRSKPRRQAGGTRLFCWQFTPGSPRPTRRA